MPELPDVVAYVDALRAHVMNARLREVQLLSPFVLRSVDPPLDAVQNQLVSDVRRIGKRIVLAFDEASRSQDQQQVFLVIHLMIAGRLRWREPGAKLGIGSKIVLARFEFERGTLYFTEAGSKKRASITLV